MEKKKSNPAKSQRTKGKPKTEKSGAKPLITKTMKIHEVVMKYPKTFPVFAKHGIGCVGCMFAETETLEEGIGAHGIDVDAFVKELNEVL